MGGIIALIRVPEFCGYEQVSTRNATLADRLSDIRLIAIDARRVNMPITNPEGKIHSVSRYSSRRTLVDSEAEDWHSHIIVQLDSRLDVEIGHRRCHRVSRLLCLKIKDSMTRLAEFPHGQSNGADVQDFLGSRDRR